MASKVIVTLNYSDGSKELSEEFGCADTHPSADLIRSLEDQMRDKWEAMGGTLRSLRIKTRIRQT